MLEIAGLTTGYGDVPVLAEVGLAAAAGETVALLGRNGSGKSSLLASAQGLVPPWRGSVHLAGRELAGRPTHRIARAGLALVPQDRRIFTDLTVRENLDVARRAGGGPAWDLDAVTGLFPALGGLLGRSGAALSGGEQQMLAIARALMGQPRVLLLDEPAEGLAPRVVQALQTGLAELQARGLTLVVAEQNLAFARAVAQRAVVLAGGTVAFAGTFAELDADSQRRRDLLAV